MKQPPIARDLRCGGAIVSGELGLQAGVSVDATSGIPCVANGVKCTFSALRRPKLINVDLDTRHKVPGLQISPECDNNTKPYKDHVGKTTPIHTFYVL